MKAWGWGVLFAGLLAAGAPAAATATPEEYLPVKLKGALREYTTVRTEASGLKGSQMTLRISIEGRKIFSGGRGWATRNVYSLPGAEAAGASPRESLRRDPTIMYHDFVDGQPFYVGWVRNPGGEGEAAFLFDPPLAVLPPRMDVGSKLQSATRLKRVYWWMWLTGTRWVAGWEQAVELAIEAQEAVTVPAGTFQALRITRRQDQGMGSSFSTTDWRAAGVGLVRSLIRRADGSQELMELVRWKNP